MAQPEADSVSSQRLNLDFKRAGDVVIANFDGEMDLYSIKHARQKLDKLKGAGLKKIVFGLQRVCYIDSTAMSFIVGISQELKTNRGYLVCVASENNFVQKVFKQSRLTKVLHLVKDEGTALELIASNQEGAPNDGE